jgi:hypothetical protein
MRGCFIKPAACCGRCRSFFVGSDNVCIFSKRYNPLYTFQSMNTNLENDKLRPRGNTMVNQSENLDQKEFQSDTHGAFFEIHVKGQLDASWSDWFENMEVKLLDNGEMILFGYIKDQAALMGNLNKIVRLNLTLLSVNSKERECQ